MKSSERAEQGRAMRRDLMGEAFVEKLEASAYKGRGMREFGAYATEAVFGGLWTRPGLDLKTRALICVVADTAIGRAPELALHLRMALRQGWSEDELFEALLHLSGYVGLPLVREAMLTAEETFATIREEGGA